MCCHCHACTTSPWYDAVIYHVSTITPCHHRSRTDHASSIALHSQISGFFAEIRDLSLQKQQKLHYNDINTVVFRSYCIPAMLRTGMSAHTLISTLGHCINLRLVITWRLVNLVPNQKVFDCWFPFSESRPSVLSVFWVLRISSISGLLNVADISKCCERLILSYERRKYGRGHPTIWLSKLKMDDAMASVTVAWTQSKVFNFSLKGMSHPPTYESTQWPRVEISVWALIPVLNIAGIQYLSSENWQMFFFNTLWSSTESITLSF